MKDCNNQTIHIGDTVTVNAAGKPRYLVGRFAQVASYGDVRIKIVPIENDPRSIRKAVRVEPEWLVLGHQNIIPRMFDTNWGNELHEELHGYLMFLLRKAQNKRIITKEQTYEILTLHDSEFYQTAQGNKEI